MQTKQIECYTKKFTAPKIKTFIIRKNGKLWRLYRGDIVNIMHEKTLQTLYNKEETKNINIIIPNLMMQKLEMGQQTFLLDPPAKTWKKILQVYENTPQITQVLQLSTTRGKQVICHLTHAYETIYPGQPIRIMLEVILWVK